MDSRKRRGYIERVMYLVIKELYLTPEAIWGRLNQRLVFAFKIPLYLMPGHSMSQCIQ